MTQPIYAIGDIHGHDDKLQLALERIARDGGPEAEVVFLGDLVDRGPDSRGVIERLKQGVADGRPWHVLLGNHDRMFARFLRGGVVHDARILSGLPWTDVRLGGLATLASYGIAATAETPLSDLFAAAQAAVPADHLAFIESRPLTLERDGRLFVHAGIRPGVALADQDPDDLVWIRDPFLSCPDPFPWLVIHGHTALEFPQHFGNRIDLDGGAGYGRPVHPAVIEGRDAWVLTEDGRQPLPPTPDFSR